MILTTIAATVMTGACLAHGYALGKASLDWAKKKIQQYRSEPPLPDDEAVPIAQILSKMPSALVDRLIEHGLV